MSPQFCSHLLHPGDPSVGSGLLGAVQELEDGKDGGDGATHHRHQEHARHVAEAKRVDPTPTKKNKGYIWPQIMIVYNLKQILAQKKIWPLKNLVKKNFSKIFIWPQFFFDKKIVLTKKC